MNSLSEVGRVTPSTLRSSTGLVPALGTSATEDGHAPLFALQESVVAGVGAQRTARLTGAMNRRVAQPSTAASSGGVPPPGDSSSETHDELAGGRLRYSAAHGK